MGPPSFVWSVVDRKVIMQRMTAYERFLITKNGAIISCSNVH